MTASTDSAALPTALTPGRRPEFAVACVEARSGFQDVVNLAVVTDGLTRRDVPDPRITLNRLIAFLSVATWERFVRDVRSVSGGPHAVADDDRTGCLRAPDGPALRILSAASSGRLPSRWRVAFPASGTGTALTFAPGPLTGSDDGLSAAVDWWVRTRHGLPQRRLPRDTAWPVTTDAYDSDGRDIGPTTARFAFAFFLQLVDQAIRELARSGGMVRERDLWLPEHWLRGQATADPDGPRLWIGDPVSDDREAGLS